MANAAAVYRPNVQIGSPSSYAPPVTRESPSRRGYGGKRWRGTYKQHGLGGLRGEVFRRDQGVCQICGGLVGCGRGPEGAAVDHIVPKPVGSDDLSNLQLTHNRCHNAKTAREQGGRGGQMTQSSPAGYRGPNHAFFFTGFDKGVGGGPADG